MIRRLTFPIILLAAGAARRMRGRDKLLEQIDGVALLRRQAEISRAATTSQVLVMLPDAPHPRHDTIDGLDVTAVCVPDTAQGVSASLRRGVSALPSNADHAMILLADMPALTVEDLLSVGAAVRDVPLAKVWRGATSDGKPGHPIVVPESLFGAFANLRGDNGGREIIARAKDDVHLVPLTADHARLDLNTPEEWDAWHAARLAKD